MTLSEIIDIIKFNHPLGGWRYYHRRDYGKGEYDIYDAKKGRPVRGATNILGINPKEKLEYDAQDDGEKSYYAAIEAKRLRGDAG
jgi:hypothetical protein